MQIHDFSPEFTVGLLVIRPQWEPIKYLELDSKLTGVFFGVCRLP